MLVRSGVEDDVRAVAREHVIEPRAVLDGADDAVVLDVRVVAVQFALERVDAVLTVPEEDEFARVEAADLPHELRADRPTSARDHHALTAQVTEDGLGI